MSDRTDTESSIHGSGGGSVEPNSIYASAPDGTFSEWDWQMLALQQQYQQHQYQQQHDQQQPPQLLQKQYQQPSQPQTHPQSLQYGTTGDIPELSQTSVYDLPMSIPQFEIPWTQATSQSELGRYEGKAFDNTLDAAIYGGEGQRTTSLPDLSWSTPSAARSTPGKESNYSAAKCTTPRLDRGPDRRHSRRQSVSYKSRARRSSPRYPISLDERYHKTVRRTKKNSWAEGEKHCYETVMCMDEVTKYHRVGYVMQKCGHPQRSREEYESLFRARRHATGGVQHEATSVVRSGDSARTAVSEGYDDGAKPPPDERGDSVVASPGR